MGNISEAREKLQPLIDRYNKNKDDKNFLSNEKQACQSLIVPLVLKLLGWNTEEPSEFKTEESSNGKRIDYVVYNQGISQFIIEAKAPSKEIFDNKEYYKQALTYGYNKEHNFAILTNFRQVVVLSIDKETEIGRINLLNSTDEDITLLLNFEKNKWLVDGKGTLFSRLGTHKRKIPVDEQLLEDMKHWREIIKKSVRSNKANKVDFDDENERMHIEEEVQKFIDRLVFISVCEDKELNELQLKSLLHDKKERYTLSHGYLLGKIRELFVEYRRLYDSDLFDKSGCDSLVIDDEQLIKVIEELRQPKERLPYDFKSIEADILGRVYENFIGHLTTKSGKEKDDIGKRKKEGIYYTPKYIVNYIVDSTVREYIKDMSFEEINKVRILDPACGSGSFLLRVIDVLVEECEKKRKVTYEEKKNLVLNCVYGVDLDPRAVAIAKLSLSLKLATQNKLLPNLGENIKRGNSLIDDKEIAKWNAFVWEDEFKEIMKTGGFDVVVGNPPYVRIQTLEGEQVEYFNRKYKSATKNYDIYALFVEKGMELLKEEGILGFILPSKFFNADYGVGLRKIIADAKSLYKIVDFKDFQVFDGATTYTCLLFLRKAKNKEIEYLELTNISNLHQIKSLTKEVLTVTKQEQPDENSWNFFSQNNKLIMAKLTRTKLKLKDISKNIFQGIITGADKVYILIKKENRLFYSQATDKNYKLDGDIIYPLLKGSRHIRKYRIENSDKYVIFPYERTNENIVPLDEQKLQKKYPQIYKYLLENKSILQLRDGGKMKGPSWYLFSRNQNLNRFGEEKIMTPSIAKTPSFTYDQKSNFFFVGSGGGGGGAYGITLQDKRMYLVVLGILNSKLTAFFIQQTSSKFSGGYFAFNRQYIENIPISIPNGEIISRIEDLVRKELQLNEQLNKLGDKKTSETTKLEQEIKRTDTEIDQLVYKIYDITEEEKTIIEKSLS